MFKSATMQTTTNNNSLETVDGEVKLIDDYDKLCHLYSNSDLDVSKIVTCTKYSYDYEFSFMKGKTFGEFIEQLQGSSGEMKLLNVLLKRDDIPGSAWSYVLREFDSQILKDLGVHLTLEDAVNTNNLKEVKLAVQRGENINKYRNWYDSYIVFAIEADWYQIALFLLEQSGLKIEHPEHLLRKAIESKRTSVVKVLINRPGSYVVLSDLFHRHEDGDMHFYIELLIDEYLVNHSPHDTDPTGDTLLTTAFKLGVCQSLVEYLLFKGCDINEVVNGKTLIATYSKRTDGTVDMLKEQTVL